MAPTNLCSRQMEMAALVHHSLWIWKKCCWLHVVEVLRKNCNRKIVRKKIGWSPIPLYGMLRVRIAGDHCLEICVEISEDISSRNAVCCEAIRRHIASISLFTPSSSLHTDSYPPPPATVSEMRRTNRIEYDILLLSKNSNEWDRRQRIRSAASS